MLEFAAHDNGLVLREHSGELFLDFFERFGFGSFFEPESVHDNRFLPIVERFQDAANQLALLLVNLGGPGIGTLDLGKPPFVPLLAPLLPVLVGQLELPPFPQPRRLSR